MKEIMKEANIDVAMPVMQLTMLVLTIGYKPDYRVEDKVLACEAPDPITICVSQFDIDRFVQEGTYLFNMEESTVENYDEWVDEYPTISNYLEFHRDWTPQIITSVYVDELARVKVARINEFNDYSKTNWEISKAFGG